MTLETNPAPRRRATPLRRVVIAGSLVAGGFVLGAGTLAVASTGEMPWHGGFHHHGARIGFLQHKVRNALDNVGATTSQEDKIHDIIAATYTDLDKGQPDREAMRKQVFDLMKAPTLDKAAVEKLRTDKVAEFDAKSKTVVDAFLDAASQLTPEQRTKLVQNAEDRMSHGGWGGWHHGDRMSPHDGQDRGPDGDHGRHDEDGDHGGDHG